ncbi:unnamed protein product [Rotaria sp. Silwood1]|nr:unnamed protein product [Rotaria sp. Silwood1]
MIDEYLKILANNSLIQVFSKEIYQKHHFRRYCSRSSTITGVELILDTKRRANAQATRMLLAVTLSLIILNIPNTIYFVSLNIYDTRKLIGIIQDILSDLPHVVNFFLYCLAGKHFRSIFINEFHLIEQKQRRLTNGASILNSDSIPSSGYNHNLGRVSSKISPLKV